MPPKRTAGAGLPFPTGAEVEVSSTEPGFKGSWYEATVAVAVAVARVQGRRYYDIDYTSLVADDDPSRPLRETVREGHLRPRAPRPADGTGYAVHQLVDAFHNDGWWPGVVSDVQGDRYTVCFPRSREVIEFGPSQMRPHLQWLHGHWVSRRNKAEAIFDEGVHVEVSGDKENYGTIWFTGTVVEVIAKNIYLVEYKKPKTGGSHDLFREFLDVQYVRPVRPSRSTIKQFALQEEIEACLCGVWVPGVISKMVGDSRYVVKLRSSDGEELELNHSEMRRFRVWSNGRWTHATKHRGRPSFAGKKADHPLSVSSSSSDIELSNTKRSKRKIRDGPNHEVKEESVPPNKERKNGNTPDQLRMEIDPKTPATDKESLAALQDFESPPSELLVENLHVEAGLQEGRLSVEQELSKSINTTESSILNGVLSNSTGNLSKAHHVNNLFSMDEIGSSLLPAERGNSKDVCGDRVIVMKQRKKLVSRKQRYREVPDKIDVGRHLSAEFKRKRVGSQKESPQNCIKMNVTCTELQLPKRSSDQVAESNELSEGVKLSNTDVLHDDASYAQANEQVDMLVDQILTPFAQDGTSPSFLTDKLQEILNYGNGIDDTVLEVENRDLPPTPKEDCAPAEGPTLDVASFAQDNIDTSTSFFRDKDEEISSFADGLIDTANDAENMGLPPSLKEDCAFARTNSTDATVDGTSRVGIMHDLAGYEAEIMSHQTDNTDGADKSQSSSLPFSKRINAEEIVLIDPASIVTRTLPFVKRSPLWESIDSMEVFRRMPQNPHFRALEQQYREEYREGMAIGLMVTFTNLEEDVRKTGVSDTEASFEVRLNALKDLSENGFDVESLRSGIEKLLEIRKILNELESKMATMKDQMFERESEKEKVGRSIKEVEKRIGALTQQRETLLRQQKDNESEIGELQKNMQVTKEAYLCARQLFYTLVTSPW